MLRNRASGWRSTSKVKIDAYTITGQCCVGKAITVILWQACCWHCNSEEPGMSNQAHSTYRPCTSQSHCSLELHLPYQEPKRQLSKLHHSVGELPILQEEAFGSCIESVSCTISALRLSWTKTLVPEPKGSVAPNLAPAVLGKSGRKTWKWG